MNQKRQEVEPGVAYILWAFCFLGICGLQRFYSGKVISGLVYLFTFGYLGFGQLVDLLLIPGMTRERNMYLLYQSTIDSANNGSQVTLVKKAPPKGTDPMLSLLKAAAAQNNVLSIGQAMIALDLPLDKVENLLNQALKQGLAHVDNDEKTGAVRYYFDV